MMAKIAQPSRAQPDGQHTVAGFTLYEPSVSGRVLPRPDGPSVACCCTSRSPSGKSTYGNGIDGAESALRSIPAKDPGHSAKLAEHSAEARQFLAVITIQLGQAYSPV